MSRFEAQVGLIGEAAQTTLVRSKALVVGAGGLGAPVIQYLAAAGVQLTIYDGDVIEESNLNRQTLYRADMVGEYKAEMAFRFAEGIDRDANHGYANRRLEGDELIATIPNYDVVVAAVDNMESRYAINAIGVHEDVPVIHGACSGYHGQVMVSPGLAGPCYRCMFEEEAAPSVERAGMERGILGPTCGVIGSLMAQEALRVLLEKEPPRGHFLDVDCYHHRIMPVKVDPLENCKHGPHV